MDADCRGQREARGALQFGNGRLPRYSTDWRYFGAIPNHSRYGSARCSQPGAAYATYFLVRASFEAPRERATNFV